MNLEELRSSIDKCNEKLFLILRERFELTRKVGELKARENLPSLDKKREEMILQKLYTMSQEYGLNEGMIENIFRIIMDEVKAEHEEIKQKYNSNKNK